MATNKSGHRPGGGIASRQHVETKVRTGTGSHSARPAGVAQIGAVQGNHITGQGGRESSYRGEPLHNPERNFNPTKYGNEIALNVKGGGPGKGRDVMACGSQGTHGAPAQGSPGLPSTKGQWPD